MDYATKSRHGVYQARFQLPSFIVSAHPAIQREFKRSLLTKNRIMAKKNLAMMVSSYQVAISWIEQRMSDLSPDEIEAIIKKAIDMAQTLDQQSVEFMGYQTIDSHKADPNFDLDEMLDFIEGLDGVEIRTAMERYFDNQTKLRSQQIEKINVSTDDMLSKMGIQVPERATVLKLVNDNSAQQGAGVHSKVKESISFQDVATEYGNKILPKYKNLNTRSERESVIKKIAAICPAKPIVKYLGRDTDDFLHYIDNMPTGLEVSDITGKSFDEMTQLRESTKGKRLSERQQKKFFSAYSGIIKHAAGRDYIDLAERVLKDHVVHVTDDIDEVVVDFNTDDLNKIFSGSYYTDYKKVIPKMSDYMHWLPLLGFFTGCRLEELCQLRLTDIREEQGVQYIDLNEDSADKKLKNKEAFRAVPIHSKLIELGFMDFINMRRSGNKRHMIFHTLSYNKSHGWHQRPSVNHSNYLGKLKIDRERQINDSLVEKKHFHSWRHSFKTRLTGEFMKCNEPDIHVDLILGHSFQGSVQKGYNHAKKVTMIPALKNSIERLPYDNVDFSHVRNHWK